MWLLRFGGYWLALCFLLATIDTAIFAQSQSEQPWNNEEITAIKRLWIDSLSSLPEDPSNKYANNRDAAALGEKIFFDNRFSANGLVSCASCHQPENHFSDGRLVGEGIGLTDRHTPSLPGIAYSPWFFWDGRADSAWSQPLEPLENPREHGGNRTQFLHHIKTHYRQQYESIFGALPPSVKLEMYPEHAGPFGSAKTRQAWQQLTLQDQMIINRTFANIGKALAAYMQTLMPGPSRFDDYAKALSDENWNSLDKTLTPAEVAGLAVFIGKGDCTHCHNGPLLTNNDFHNIGLPLNSEKEHDPGRIRGIQLALENEFNCLGPYSDASVEECAELNFAKTNGSELKGAFRVPSLRNIAQTAPYMHTGQFSNLQEVVKHYKTAPFTFNGKTELLPLNLSDQELIQLEAFLGTLTQH